MCNLSTGFVHQNFPSRHKQLLLALAKEERRVAVVGLKIIHNKLLRGQTPRVRSLGQEHEAKVICGEAVAATCNESKHSEFAPNLICEHPLEVKLFFEENFFQIERVSFAANNKFLASVLL